MNQTTAGMKKIIVPTDFSEGALNALKHAVELAKKFNAPIEVVHAFSMPSAGNTVMVDITDILEKNAKEELGTFEKKISDSGLDQGVEISYTARHGSVVDVLQRISDAGLSSLVVMGTHGASGFSEKWLGSNAAAATKAVSIPLIIVPSKSAFKPVKNVMFATDMKVMKNEDPLQILALISDTFGSTINFVHIQCKEETVDNSEYKSQVARFLGESKSNFKILQNEDVELGITKAIASEKPDLLVAVRHDYGFFEGLFHSSVSQHIVNTAAHPILVVNG